MQATEKHAAQPLKAQEPHWMEIWISRVLRVGVVTAAAIIGCGLFAYLALNSHTNMPMSLSELQTEGTHSVSLHSIASGVGKGQSAAIIQLGLLALILTPVSRVALSLVLFGAQRDRVFVGITAVVLIVLLLGVLGIIG